MRAKRHRERKVLVPLLLQDPIAFVSDAGDFIPETEWVPIVAEGPFRDGPISPRVAIIDWDAERGSIRPGARRVFLDAGEAVSYLVPAVPQELRLEQPHWPYDFDPDVQSDAFLQVNVFSIILRTIELFEKPEVLGRRVRWAFHSSQLLVVPRAGTLANAFYQRESHSLQFFSFPSPANAAQLVHASLSHDIVCHECAHALLDGIAPDLYSSVTPQSRAIHEAIADISAFIMSLEYESQLLWGTLALDDGPMVDVRGSSVHSWIAEEFGRSLQAGHGAEGLRNVNNDCTLDPEDSSRDSLDRPNYVEDVEDIYRLSSVLTGALFQVFTRSIPDLDHNELHSQLRREYKLRLARDRFVQFILRGLEYLPPGDASFADYARAVIAADQVDHPRTGRERGWLIEELTRRKVVAHPDELAVEGPFHSAEMKQVKPGVLARSDEAAERFAEANRALLRIPAKVNFAVAPRVVSKRRVGCGSRQERRELIFKVSWAVSEENRLGRPYPAMRRATVGSTLVIEWTSGRVLALLTTGQGDVTGMSSQRDSYLQYLVGEGLLTTRNQAVGPDGQRLKLPMVARSRAGVMELEGGARMLHLCKPCE